jgi:hypothetical protein
MIPPVSASLWISLFFFTFFGAVFTYAESKTKNQWIINCVFWGTGTILFALLGYFEKIYRRRNPEKYEQIFRFQLSLRSIIGIFILLISWVSSYFLWDKYFPVIPHNWSDLFQLAGICSPSLILLTGMECLWWRRRRFY